MTLDELLASLRGRGVELWREGDHLRYRASAETLTPELLGQLREQKAAILEFLKRAEAPGQQQPPLQATPRRGNQPLSFAQERLWFLDRLEPDSAVYNIPMGLRLKGELNVPVLQRCLDEILRRHEALRTHFEALNGQPRQVIEPVAALPTPLVDLSGMPQPEWEADAMRVCNEEARRPFDLRHDLMLRAKLLRLGESQHVLLLTTHHIASDGWSLGVLLRELATLYEAFADGKASPLPELAVQYADFAVWQREWLQGPILEPQLNYWRKQLEGAPALLELPTDRPRPVTQKYRGALMPWELPKPLSVALGELSRREGATLFMTLLAAFQTVLHRYTSSDDILVGSPIAGRNRTELEPLIGLFLNTLVLRGDLSGNPSFRTLLGRTREMALGAYAHQHVPFERLVEELHPKRDLSHSPFFQVMFTFQNAPRETARLAGLEVTTVPVDSGTSKFELTLFVSECGGTLQAAVEYDTDLFEAETIRRMLGHYQALLEGIVSNPDQRLSDLPLLTDAERRQLLVEWNDTRAELPRDKCAHQLFEEQAARTPQAPAVADESEALTYRELNERAGRLAAELRDLGVGPDVCVGVCLGRSVEMVVAMLAILKAGGAYVPLDPDYPAARLAFMLRDTKMPVVLLRESTRKNLRLEIPNVQLLCVDSSQAARRATRDPARQLRQVTIPKPDNLAYVIYTSGSTGLPKGVEIEHASLVNLIAWHQRAYAVTPADRAAQIASPAFDACVWELWPYLAAGAAVHIPGEETRLSPAKLAAWLATKAITLAFIPTPLAEAMLDEPWPEKCGLRALLTGGDKLHHPPSEKVPCVLVNHYGPAESTVVTTQYLVPPGKRSGQAPPIGRPIANTQVYILDPRLQPVPVGMPGELHIGGTGLARGYHNRPELTAEKFIPNPFPAPSGGRLYRTGDLVRWLPEGKIEFLGRLDHQVKIRGFRIELGEIESVLVEHPAVREAVVFAREDVPGDKRLVAYLTAKEGLSPKPSELRGLLRAKLPEYMVPSAFVTLDRFPLTPNGKVDRKALPQPDQAGATTGLVPPTTPAEVALANIWSEVLGLKQVGVHDNFFDLGGHSLLAVRLQTRVEKELGRRLPLAAFFQAPTVGELAALLADPSAPSQGLLMSTPQSSADRPRLFYLHFLDQAQRLAKYLGPKWPVYAFTAPFDEELRLWHETHRLAISMEELAARCVPIIQRVQPKGPYRLGGGCFGGVLAFEIAVQLKGLGEEVALLALIDAFYAPSCKRRSFPRLRRWAYHGRRALSDGINYPATKWRLRRELAKKHRSQLEAMRAGDLRPREEDAEGIRLPQAEFMAQIQKPYKAHPYSGSALLIRGALGPFFGFDPGAANGWEAVIRGDLRVEDLHCGHMDISEEPHVSTVARWLEKHLSALEKEAETRTGKQASAELIERMTPSSVNPCGGYA